MKNALLTSGIAASLLSLSFAAPSLQEPARPLRAQQPGDRVQPDDLRAQKEANLEQRTMRQVGDAYRSLRKASLDVLRAYASDWGSEAQPNDIVAHRREAVERREDAGRKEDDRSRNGERRGDAGAEAPTTPPPTTHPGYALQGEELLIAACTDGLLAGAPIYGAHTEPEPGGDRATEPGQDPSKSKDERSTEGRKKDDAKGSDDDARDERSVRDRLQDLGDHSGGRNDEGTPDLAATAKDKNKDKKDKADRPATDLQRGATVGMLLVCAYGDGASTDDPGRRAQNGKDAVSNANSTRDDVARADRPVPAVGQLRPGVFAVHRAGDSVWLTDEAGSVVLRTEIQSERERDSSVSETEAERQRIRNQIASSSFADGGEDWELVFGAITKEAMTSMGWAKAERVSVLRR